MDSGSGLEGGLPGVEIVDADSMSIEALFPDSRQCEPLSRACKHRPSPQCQDVATRNRSNGETYNLAMLPDRDGDGPRILLPVNGIEVHWCGGEWAKIEARIALHGRSRWWPKRVSPPHQSHLDLYETKQTAPAACICVTHIRTNKSHACAWLTLSSPFSSPRWDMLR